MSSASQPKDTLMRVTVVIPAHNAASTLGPCLDALAAQGVPGPMAELIVVNDASTDGTAAVATRPGITVLSGPGTGPAAARNMAAEVAGGELLAYLDSDTVPLANWLEEILAPLTDPQVVAVKGRYYTRQRSILARFAQLEFEWKYARLEQAKRVDFVDTGNASYRRSTFLAAGGFDEGFKSWRVGSRKISASEDVELAFRLASQGAHLVFNPRAAVFHHHTEDLPGYFLKKVRAAFTRTLVYGQYPDKALGDSYTPPAMGLQIGLAGVATLLAGLRLVGMHWMPWALRGTLIAFGATTTPLVRRAMVSDPSLAWAVPALVFLRAFAQGIGAATAMASRFRYVPEYSEPDAVATAAGSTGSVNNTARNA